MAGKATTIKEALRRWEEKNNQIASEAKEMSLCFEYPPIEKMDNSLAVLTQCTKLSLSTNMIEKVSGISKFPYILNFRNLFDSRLIEKPENPISRTELHKKFRRTRGPRRHTRRTLDIV